MEHRPTNAQDIGTASDVARLLRVDEDTIYKLARTGQLPAFRVGRQWRFDLRELARRFQTSARGS